MENTYYWLAVIGYSLVVIAVAFWLRWRGNSGGQPGHKSMEFWLAGRSFSGWRLGMSIAAGWLMLGWIGFGMSQIYMYGLTGLWILPIPWFILCFLIIAIVPFVRRVGAISLPEAIEKRFGLSARALLAVFSFFVFIAWTQAELFMAGSLMSPFLGVEPWVCMVVLLVPIMIYTTLGGFRAIVMTDLIQFLIMAGFMAVLAATAYGAAGAASGGSILSALDKITPPWTPAGAETGAMWNLNLLGWGFPVLLLIGYLPGWLIEQDLTLRIQAARSTREALKGSAIALGLITVFIVVLPRLGAFGALVACPPAGGAPPDAIGADATGIISALIARLPLAGVVFMLVGIVACQMSTVDTFTNVSAMPLAYDIIAPLLRKRNLSDAGKAKLGRIVSLAVMVIALALATISSKLGDVYYISSGVLSASIAVPAIFVFWKRTTLPGVLVSSVLGFVSTVGMYFYEYDFIHSGKDAPAWLAQGAYGYNYIAFGVIVSLVSIVVVSLLTARSRQELLAAVRPQPIDDLAEFQASVEKT